MIAALQDLVHRIGPQSIAAAVALYAIVTALFTLIAAGLALRAKKRANIALQRALAADNALSRLVRQADGRPFTSAEIELMREAILQNILELSQRDQRFVNAGLQQRSARGFERFIGDVTGHKLAA